MKKITCMLLLIQSGFIMAQTKTVITQNGEKVAISTGANNGLTANNGYIQLGGALTQPSILTTTSAFTLAIQGLQTGSSSDNVLVTDSNGILKYVSRSSFSGADNLGNHIATTDLNISDYSIFNIKNAYVKNEAQFIDRLTSNTNYFSIFKENGDFGIWNSLKGTNALTINETTNKTTLTSTQILRGTDGVAPVPGAIATAADAAGNIIWKAPVVVPGVVTPRLVGFAKVGTARSSGIKVFFDTNVLNPENAFTGDVTNGTVYNIKKAGLHQIFVNLTVGSPSGAWYLRIKKNGTPIAAIDATTASGASAVVFAIDDFAAGDQISVDMGGNATGYQASLTRIAIFRFDSN
ncbi:hypothetical protein [Flavobacterium saccharophilum]|nr:hypothetical protein [Flavobacterium saccharophilum]